MITKLPFSLIIFRLVMAPAVLAIAWYAPAYKYVIGIICYLAIISDIFDGIIARHAGMVTPRLRLWDSNVDLVFWLSTCVAVGICFPWLVRQNYYYILPLFILEPIPDAIYYSRFKKFGCAHNYCSKFFGLALLTSFSFFIFR